MPEPKFEGIKKDPFEVDLRDKVARQIQASYVGPFDETGLAMAVLKETPEKKHLVNKKGEILAGPFGHLKPFKEDLARVKKDDGYYFINREGKEVIGPFEKYLSVQDFDGGFASITDPGVKTYFINKKGEKVDKKEEHKPYQSPFEAPIEYPIKKMGAEGLYLINKEGKEIAGPFVRIDKFKEGLALVNIKKEGEHYGEHYFINKEGKIILGPYDGNFASGFNDGVATVIDNNKKGYFIDHNGKRVFSDD